MTHLLLPVKPAPKESSFLIVFAIIDVFDIIDFFPYILKSDDQQPPFSSFT